jgi:acetyl-CoA decarbonylase/synthase complex subunit gamma
MALSGIQIYKLLPQTNCKECGFPTCLAFAMKLAAKQVELSACPYVSDESKAQLEESSAPPIRLISLKSDGYEIKAGNEVVLYRHEKTFFNRPGIFIQVEDDWPVDKIKSLVEEADKYEVNYVGIELSIDGFAVVANSGDAQKFSDAISAVRSLSKRPVILVAKDAKLVETGLGVLGGETPMICCADDQNADGMAALASKSKAALAISSDSIEGLAGLADRVKNLGVEDIVLYPNASGLSANLALSTQIRRLALRKNFRSLGYPTITFAGTPTLATQAITKYAGFVVLDRFAPDLVYPLLVLRQNIYTDPQKPIQVLPGLYEINNPKPEDPVLVTTNFSITYFSVANEVEGSGLPAWLVVADAEGMSVLTAWAAGKFDSERIAKSIKGFNVGDKVSKKRLIIPGHVAVLSGELEADLPDWEIRVGPREAVDLPKFMKQAL